MTPLRFGFEPATLEGWLAFQRLPQCLAGRSVVVEYLPLPAPAARPPGPAAAGLAEQALREGLPWPAAARAAADAQALCALLWAAAPPGRGPSRHRCALLLDALWQHAEAPDAAAVQRRRAQLQLALGLDEAARPPRGPDAPAALAAASLVPDAALPGHPWLQPLAGPLAGQVFVGLDGQDALAARLAEAGPLA
ncbi:MAG: hypothetical protein L6Q75_17070 [Burkholderiaceae bacterium]|nr:hypothetical protein [Burkholderiaceae bacterium]